MLLAFGCCLTLACSDSRCNATNCAALTNCAVRLQGSIDGTCAALLPNGAANDLAAELDAGIDFCIQACNANNAGALVQCVAQSFPGDACHDLFLDGGNQQTAVMTACIPDAGSSCGTSCQSCQTQCGQTDQACVQGCVDAGGGFGTCNSCDFNCNQQNVACVSKCPSN
jgi:hypothetical protein